MSLTKGMVALSVTSLLFLGVAPIPPSCQDGVFGLSQVHAAGGRGGGHAGGGGNAASGSGGGHSSGGHTDDRHGDDHGDDHDHDDADGEGASSAGKKGKGPAYRGGRIGSSKGRGGPSRAVVEMVFENE